MVVTGLRLPSLAPVKDALVAHLQADLQDALDLALAQDASDLLTTGQAPMQAPASQNVSQAVYQTYDQVQGWPTVTVTGWNLALRGAAEQAPVGRWEGEILLAAFVQNGDADRLAAALDRWGSALYAVAVSAHLENALAGAQLTNALAIIPREPAGGTAYSRVVFVSLGVSLEV